MLVGAYMYILVHLNTQQPDTAMQTKITAAQSVVVLLVCWRAMCARVFGGQVPFWARLDNNSGELWCEL